MSMELLSPAGGAEQLRAAVQSGADAVYMGGCDFSARRGAKNFTPDEMKKMIDYCHAYGVKVHIAVNTLIKEKELDRLLEYAYSLNRMGADALIIQDIGAAEMIKKAVPQMPLHASTQMTVTSAEGVKYLENMGFERVVLARELSKKEIEYICRNTKAEIEVFVHGAICQCYSGQCLMSSILGGRSGNRGVCAQPCRLKYSLSDGKSGYMLSPKDMALINELSELEQIGVTSLKIEGRLKRAEYVSAVTGIYRKYLDMPSEISAEDMKELTEAFSRSGFTDGYFTGKIGSEMMSSENPSNTKNYFTAAAKARTAKNADFRKVPIDVSAYLSEGELLTVTLSDGEHYITEQSETVSEKAENRPIDSERLKEQLSKLGGTPFEVRNADIYVSDGITIPIKEINEVRRTAVTELIKSRTETERRKENEFEFKSVSRTPRHTVCTASVRTEEQVRAAIDSGIKIIYAPIELAERINQSGVQIIADSRDIFSPDNIKLDNVLVSSNAAANYYSGKSLYGNFRLNVFNSLSAEHYGDFESVTLSPELNLKEIGELLKNTNAKAEIIVYGRLPLMIMKNCPLKGAGRCQNKKRRYALHDRKNEDFPILCGRDCICEILNSKPIFTADKLDDITRLPIDFARLMFTIEDYDECCRISRLYLDALDGKKAVNPFGTNEFTRGHFYRGTE